MELTDREALEQCRRAHDLGMDLNNARELGGYRMKDGRRIKRGLLLRTTRLCDASAEDLRRLQEEFHVSLILDMRGEDEAAEAPDPEIPGAAILITPIIGPHVMEESVSASAQAHQAPHTGQSGRGEQASGSSRTDQPRQLPDKLLALLPEGTDPADLSDQKKARKIFDEMMAKDPTFLFKLIAATADLSDMTGSYAAYLKSDFGQKGFRRFFRGILDTEEGAVLWHCLTGKDRTGIGAALLLSILGADWDTILMDYELSNLYFEDRVKAAEESLAAEGYDRKVIDSITCLVGVHPDMLIRAWQYMEEAFGSVENYLKEAIGLTEEDFEVLRERYLEQAAGDGDFEPCNKVIGER